MRLPRPYIPLDVKCTVAERQVAASRPQVNIIKNAATEPSNKARLAVLLHYLFGDEPVHLDHEPALALRHRSAAGRYKPAANNPDHLVWRTGEAHRTKTLRRGDHGQHSDIALIRRAKKRKLKSLPKKPARKWPKRKLRA
jgi:hypothetical protein